MHFIPATLLVGGLALGAAAPPSPSDVPPGRIRITSSPSTTVRVIARPAARLRVLGGAPARRRGDTLFVRTPVELAATLARSDVRIEVVGSTEVTVEADVAPPPSTRRLGAIGRGVFVLRAGGRAIETPGALHRGIQEGDGAGAPGRAEFAPDAALSRAFPIRPGAVVFLSRPDTMITLAVPCPAGGGRAAARRVVIPGAGGVAATLTIGPDAHRNGLGAAVVFPPHPTTREEAATAGTLRVAGGCAFRDTLRVTVDSLVFPSRRLTLARPVSLVVTLPAP